MLASKPPLWDVFCRVIDNFGDIGVCWRLCAELAARGRRVRLRVDDARALAWMAPDGAAGVEVLGFDAPWTAHDAPSVVVEAFGCEAPAAYLQELAAYVQRTRADRKKSCVLINLEYLSAEPYVQRCHGLPSPIGHAPGAGLVRWFFYPGFTTGTGGLIVERDLQVRMAAFDRAQWRRAHGMQDVDATAISLFCYEPPGLPALLAQLPAGAAKGEGGDLGPKRLFTAPSRAHQAVEAALQSPDLQGELAAIGQHITPLEWMSQAEFDAMLHACDLNFVRGEDSLVRALWAARPFVWQIYPQDDGAHWAKLEAFLNWLDAPASLRRWHAAWSGQDGSDWRTVPALDARLLAQWGECVLAARARLWQQADLIENLDAFVAEKS